MVAHFQPKHNTIIKVLCAMILFQVFLYPASSQPLADPFKTLRSSIKSLKHKIKVDDTGSPAQPHHKAHASAGTNDHPTTHHPHVPGSENRHPTIPSFLNLAPRVCRYFATEENGCRSRQTLRSNRPRADRPTTFTCFCNSLET
jgi:hypothetical protein